MEMSDRMFFGVYVVIAALVSVVWTMAMIRQSLTAWSKKTMNPDDMLTMYMVSMTALWFAYTIVGIAAGRVDLPRSTVECIVVIVGSFTFGLLLVRAMIRKGYPDAEFHCFSIKIRRLR